MPSAEIPMGMHSCSFTSKTGKKNCGHTGRRPERCINEDEWINLSYYSPSLMLDSLHETLTSLKLISATIFQFNLVHLFLLTKVLIIRSLLPNQVAWWNIECCQIKCHYLSLVSLNTTTRGGFLGICSYFPPLHATEINNPIICLYQHIRKA